MGGEPPYIQIEGMIDGSLAIDWVSYHLTVETWNTTNLVQSLLDQLFENQVMETMQ